MVQQGSQEPVKGVCMNNIPCLYQSATQQFRQCKQSSDKQQSSANKEGQVDIQAQGSSMLITYTSIKENTRPDHTRSLSNKLEPTRTQEPSMAYQHSAVQPKNQWNVIKVTKLQWNKVNKPELEYAENIKLMNIHICQYVYIYMHSLNQTKGCRFKSGVKIVAVNSQWTNMESQI